MRGDNVCVGYWHKPELSESVFGAVINQPSEGTDAGPWLRTGDLGFLADGQLYVLSDSGELVLVAASPDSYKENGRFQAFEPSRCWTAPSLADGKLYLRNNVEMVAFDVTK